MVQAGEKEEGERRNRCQEKGEKDTTRLGRRKREISGCVQGSSVHADSGAMKHLVDQGHPSLPSWAWPSGGQVNG